ncbi:SRPBCC family protein [Ancylomarina euxinus]|uniref:SRPBCC family protein n=1 Tax=Ancylomarina euxinus TaxID=2283627 RepID=A0A425XXR2_9BACT|nr:SRPBCC family protein [Ancylomarina euxinus]MCZ4696003.1 SRPBCC family protein [Ancylomarina euxinus]MUP13944.1 SRPBCC family protein [Ancylomarina euxinus]RRG19500.1 SRPBCC family protein [Ancylomarina euxinus]
MKYEVEVDINLSREIVIRLFDNPANMKHWQPGLVSVEHLSGQPGEVGAKSKLYYKMGKREVVMIETITSKNLPSEFSGTYEAKGVWNHVQNYFIEINENKTVWKSVNEFRCTGFFKIMIFLMPGMFKKETCKHLVNFKEFAESI